MSAALVRKSLALVDPDINLTGKKSRKSKKVSNILDLIPDNQKVTKTITRRGQKVEKINALHGTKKLTVIEAKKNHKSKEQRLKDNLEKIKLIQQACAIQLDHGITEQIIERAVTRRPIKTKKPKKILTETAFTEEDFKKFEEEYFDE